MIDSLHHFVKLSSTFLSWESFSSLSLCNKTSLYSTRYYFRVYCSFTCSVCTLHSSTLSFKYTCTHVCAHTNAHGPFSSASLSECDWLITTQKAWLCWCQKQDRYPRPQGAQRRLMSLSFTTPISFFHSLHLSHAHFYTCTYPLTRVNTVLLSI